MAYRMAYMGGAVAKATRRQYGSGSVYQRADGRWFGVVEAGWTAAGTRRRVSVSAATEAEAKRRLRDKGAKVSQQSDPGVLRRATVHAWSERWLAERRGDLRPKTWKAYRASIRWVDATIGARRLSALTPDHVRTVDKAQRDKGLSERQVIHTRSVLMKMLKDGVVEGYEISPRVFAMRRPKAVDESDRLAMTVEQAGMVLDGAAKLEDGSRWVAALLTGARQAELLGLTWPMVDLERGLIEISWQLQALPYADKAAGTFAVPHGYEHRHLVGAYHLVRPKTEKGRRIVPMLRPLWDALLDWRDKAPASPHELVWPTVKGRPRDAKADLRAWKALQGTVGVKHPTGRPYLLHEARDTAATLLLEAGVDSEVIKSVLGHSSVVTTRGYQHVSTALARQGLERMGDRLALGR